MHPGLNELYDHRVMGRNMIIKYSKTPDVVCALDSCKKSDYIEQLSRAKICVAPYGLGGRIALDQLGLLAEAIVVKPDMSYVYTEPNIYTDEYMEFVECDWSGLEDKITHILDNYDNYKEIALKRKEQVKQFDKIYYGNCLINHLNRYL